MTQKRTIVDLIGNTPLLYLRHVSELTGCDIYGKAEFLNPGGSVKDRTALGIVRDAEARTGLTDFRGEFFGVFAADAGVDVMAVGLVADGEHLGAEAA